MIAIREANSKIDLILTKHVSFISPYVKKNISFYAEVFKLLPSLQKPKTTQKKIKEEIFRIKEKYETGHYKALIKPILKGKLGVKNEKELMKLKYIDNFIPPAKNFPLIILALDSLLKNVDAILALDFNQNQASKLLQYSSWKKEYASIGFLIKLIFNYEGWFSELLPTDPWGPYQLAKALNIRTCSYCNRHYTFSLTDGKGKKMGRPDFDHFLPKSSDPLLSISFFNLLPSCKDCNGPTVKSSKPVSYSSHLNPYEENALNGLMRFTYIPNTYEASVGEDEELKIVLRYSGNASDTDLQQKVEGNIQLFYLADIYNHHTDTVQEIIRKRHVSNDKYIEILQTTFKGFNLSRDEAYRLAYGNYFDERDFHKRPMSKLTKDIAIEMQSIEIVSE